MFRTHWGCGNGPFIMHGNDGSAGVDAGDWKRYLWALTNR
jgi:hypothetical protein